MSKQVRRRAFDAQLQLRDYQDDDEKLRISGYAAVFDSPAHGEVVDRTAFNRTLQDQDDVRLLVNHSGVPLARTRAGTLDLAIDATGLRCDAELDRSNPAVAELASAISRGDIDQMSFAFIPVREEYDSDDGLVHLQEVRLRDVSVVTYPWYEETSVEMASADAALAALERAADQLDDDQIVRVRQLAGAPASAPADDEPAPRSHRVELERARSLLLDG